MTKISEKSIKLNGPISWMAGNPVASNLLMLLLLVGGIIFSTRVKQEVFPEFTLDQVTISVSYPGASPDEIEKGIILPIEEAIQEINEIKEVFSKAGEGTGTVTVEAIIDTNIEQLAIDIKNGIDRITSFPKDAEKPLVKIPSRHRGVITLIIYGAQDEQILRETAEQVRDQLLSTKKITRVELTGDRPLEMSIEIPQEVLRTYHISLSDVASKIRAASLDLPGGSIKTEGGEILVRIKERKDYTFEFSQIPIVTSLAGTIITLGDIAEISDGFEDIDKFLTYNGNPAIGINVFRVGDQTPISISDAVHKHIKQLKETLPDGIYVDYANDRSEIFRQRIDLLLKNGYLGLILVFALLGIFLEARLAFWVTMGIPISFLGSLLFIPYFDISINMVSLFAFIISLGIVVDDAIVVGENIYRARQEGDSFFEASINGTKEIATPVIFSVLTNIVAFMPLYFVPGVLGKIFRNIPVVVVTVFAISLVESLLVLPAHLGHHKGYSQNRVMLFFHKQQQRISYGFKRLIHTVYGPILQGTLRFRYVSITLGVTILIITISYIKSGRMGITMFPRVESDLAYASFTLPFGVSVKETKKVINQLVASANDVIEKNGGDKQVKGILSNVSNNTGWIQIYMTPPEIRPVSTGEFIKKWRTLTGNISGLESLRFKSDFGGPGSGAALTVELMHRNTKILEAAGVFLAEALSFFPIVSDIDDGFSPGKKQFDFIIKPEGYRLGLTPETVARQIRDSYYGSEVLRQLRGRNEIKIMVRRPQEERRSEYDLDEMILFTPKGEEVPLRDVVTISKGRAYTTINRRNGRRVITVTSDVNPPSQAGQVIASLKADILPEMKKKYLGLDFNFEGKQADMKESFKALGQGMIIAVLLIYVLLAIPFRSYIQPAIIMISIPFGIIGAICGHLIMGFSLSMISMFGIVALSGVVVNDSLVLIDFANSQTKKGATPYMAIINAGTKRFRPIILTTLTTFFGLMPMIFETSRQARFLVPMAISLGFGILFATVITLILVPSLYLIEYDLKIGFYNVQQWFKDCL